MFLSEGAREGTREGIREGVREGTMVLVIELRRKSTSETCVGSNIERPLTLKKVLGCGTAFWFPAAVQTLTSQADSSPHKVRAGELLSRTLGKDDDFAADCIGWVAFTLDGYPWPDSREQRRRRPCGDASPFPNVLMEQRLCPVDLSDAEDAKDEEGIIDLIECKEVKIADDIRCGDIVCIIDSTQFCCAAAQMVLAKASSTRAAKTPRAQVLNASTEP